MEITRTLRRVGGSVVVAIPPEMLEETGLAEGRKVVVRSREGRIELEPEAELSTEFVTWVHRNLKRYEHAYRELADR